MFTHWALIWVGESQAFHKNYKNFEDKLLHQRIFLPVEKKKNIYCKSYKIKFLESRGASTSGLGTSAGL